MATYTNPLTHQANDTDGYTILSLSSGSKASWSNLVPTVDSPMLIVLATSTTGLTIVQEASISANTWPITLAASPIAGNTLICLCTQYSVNNVGAQNGWTVLANVGDASQDDAVWVLAKVAGAGEPAAQSPLSDPNPRGMNAVVYEVSGPVVIADITAQADAETNGASASVADTATGAGSLFLVMAASTGSETLPALTGNAAVDTSATGTSNSASPRAVSGAHGVVAAGPVTATATWSSAVNTYMASALIALTHNPHPFVIMTIMS